MGEGGGKQKGRSEVTKARNGDEIGRSGSGRGDTHLRILQAPQAENCSRAVLGWASDFWARWEEEEEEPSEGEPELCPMGIIGEERERKTREGGGTS
jgi:hypothetical protein